jgi:uncharacterized beta-barrel protein YwiB (DUF1934 family)
MKVKIKVFNRQTADGETGEIMQSVSGDYEYNGGSFSLSYEENGELTGVTSVSFDGKNLTVNRINSEFDAELRFTYGERLRCSYFTPYGEIRLETDTKRIFTSVNEKGGTVKLDYELYAGLQLQSTNEMIMEITAEETDV